MARKWHVWLPILISLVAVFFTGLQWWEAHTQLLLAVKPYVDFYTADDPDSPPVGIAISNAGPGPANIKSVTFYVDRKSVRDAEEAGITYANLSQAELDYFELEPEDTLAVGEKNLWLIEYRKPRAGKINQKNIEKFADFIDQHLAVEVTFCSIMGNCWTKCSTKGRCG
jgi:hypothetical protein